MSVIQIEFADRKLDALTIYLADSRTTVGKELDAAMEALWEKYVPEDVRLFIERSDRAASAARKKRPTPPAKPASGAEDPDGTEPQTGSEASCTGGAGDAGGDGAGSGENGGNTGITEGDTGENDRKQE